MKLKLYKPVVLIESVWNFVCLFVRFREGEEVKQYAKKQYAKAWTYWTIYQVKYITLFGENYVEKLAGKSAQDDGIYSKK